jgi:hypothetical protein
MLPQAEKIGVGEPPGSNNLQKSYGLIRAASN